MNGTRHCIVVFKGKTEIFLNLNLWLIVQISIIGRGYAGNLRVNVLDFVSGLSPGQVLVQHPFLSQCLSPCRCIDRSSKMLRKGLRRGLTL